MKKIELKELRGKIDSVDSKIIELVKERFSLTKKISTVKRRMNLPKIDKVRESDIISALCKKNKKIDKKAVSDIYRAIFRHSRKQQ